MSIERIGVVGFGLMGSGIAQVCAQAGLDTVAHDVDRVVFDRGFERIDSSLARLVRSGKVAERDAAAARGRIHPSGALADLADRELVIEAVVEKLELKQQVFTQLDSICPPTTIFVSNTSSLPIGELAAATQRPDRFAGLHFFNPVPVMRLVEIVRAIATSDETVDALRGFVERIGKSAVVCRDTTGFIVNRLLVPYMLSAVRALEAGVASAEEIDRAMMLGAGMPMGPLALIDYTGLDVNLYVANIMFDEFKEPQYAPPQLLRRLVAAGRLGRKTGRGFYEYDERGERKSG
jgi:3-hydroxybutyryl-CoA dehydrogenase